MVEGTGHPPERRRLALGFDQDLKRRGINPGTSADLTVGSLFAALLGRGLASATTSHPKGGTHG